MAAHCIASALILALALATTQVKCWGDLDDHPGMRGVQAKCQQNVPVDPLIYARAQQGDFQVTDHNLQRYIHCILSTAKVMDDTGKIEMSQFIKGMIPEASEYFGPKFIACQNTVDDGNKYVKSLKMYECIRDTAGDKWYFL